MGKAPSIEQQLRNAKRELAALLRRYNDAISERDHYRAKSLRATSEVTEWKSRFDRLLARVPEMKDVK